MLIFPPLKRRTSKSEDDARWRRSPDEEYSSSSSSSSSLSSSSRSKSSSSESSSSSKRMYRYHHLYKVIDFITLFFVWASPLLKDLHPKRDLFRLQNFIRKSSSSLPSKTHPLKRVIELFSIINERIKTTRERRNSKLEMFSLRAQSVSTVSALRNCRANSRVNRCDAFRSSRLMRGANFSFFFPLWEISLNAEQSEISLVALFLFLRFVRPQRSSRGPLSER